MIFHDVYLIITGALEDIVKNLFTVEKSVSEIDVSIIVNNGYLVLRFIYDGHTYNPFENSKLLKTDHIKGLDKFNHNFNYYNMFDMNYSYVKIYKR